MMVMCLKKHTVPRIEMCFCAAKVCTTILKPLFQNIYIVILLRDALDLQHCTISFPTLSNFFFNYVSITDQKQTTLKTGRQIPFCLLLPTLSIWYK